MDRHSERQAATLHDDESRANPGTPGRSTVTARMTRSPTVVFRVADPATAHALGTALRGTMRDAEGAEQAVAEATQGTGTPLPKGLRARFETSLGADLSAVRVHTGAASVTAAAAVGAQAFAVGNDIHFGTGKYQPDDPFGLHLLAHEVAHTVQQAGVRPVGQAKLEVSNPDEPLEHDADRAAAAMVQGQPYRVAGHVGGGRPLVARQAIKLPFSDLDELPRVPPGAASVLPPPPFDWSGTPAVAAYPGRVSWHGQPAYKPEFAAPGNLEPFRDAFGGSWATTRDSFNQAVKFHETLHGSAQRIPAILRISDGAKVGAQGAHVNATDAFAGTKVKGAEKMDAAAVGEARRRKIIVLKGELEQAHLDVKTRGLEMKDTESGVQKASNLLEIAIGSMKISEDEAAIERTGLDRAAIGRELDAYKADVRATVETTRLVTAAITGLYDPAKVIDATAAVAEADKVASVNRKLATLDAKVAALQHGKAGLTATNAALVVKNAVLDLGAARRAVQRGLNAYEGALIKHRATALALSSEMKQAGEASNMTKQDAKLMAAAVEALPQIDEIIGFCASMEAALPTPVYSQGSGVGAAMATNTKEFQSRLGLVKGNAQYVRETRALWEARRASVEAVIASATAV